MRHIGGVILNEKEIVNALGFHGGRLLYAYQSKDYLGMRLNIEHPDMPVVNDGNMIPVVNVVFHPIQFGNIILLPNRRLVRKIKDALTESWHTFRIVWKG